VNPEPLIFRTHDEPLPMYVTITSLQLKGPFLFFKLSYLAMKIVGQLKANSACKQYKSHGFWTLHYTMSLWQDEKALKDFAKEGAHLHGMKNSKALASEIKTYTFPADKLPDWKTAKELLNKNGRSLKF
jgi:hypothetical protein